MIGPLRPPCEIPDIAAPAGRPTRWVMPVAILGSSLSLLDGSVVNIALPAIQSSLGARLSTAQWIASGYTLSLASLILIGGRAGDLLGNRRILMAGLAGFGAMSLACGFSGTSAALIAARVGQGAAAAFVIPASLALIGSAFEGEARARAIGTWAAAGAITTALGPPLGGWLVETIGWRSIFFVNLPVAVTALLLAARMAPNAKPARTGTLDYLGAVLGIAALGALSLALIAGGNDRLGLGMAALGAAALLGPVFLFHEARTRSPMMPLRLFARREFAAANIMTLALYAAWSATLFLIPFVLIDAAGFDALSAGAALLPISIVMGAGSRLAGIWSGRFGGAFMLVAGSSVTACGYLLLALFAGRADYASGFLPGLTVVGVGMTLSISPLTTMVLDAVDASDGGAASGINNAAARIGGLLAVAAVAFAFAGNEISNAAPGLLRAAYRSVTLASAGLAGISAFVAGALLVSRDRQCERR